MVPLLLVEGWDIAGALPSALAILIFIVGGRLVSSLAAEARRRRSLSAPHRPPLSLGYHLLGTGLLHPEGMGLLVLLATAF